MTLPSLGREELRLFQKVLELLPDSIIVVDDRNRIIHTNRHAAGLFGYTQSELAGRPLDILVPERFTDVHRGFMKGYFSSPRRRPMGEVLDLIGRRKDGTEFAVDISLSPVSFPGGLLVLADIRDRTVRKQAEEELKRSREQLRALTARLQAAREEEQKRIAREIHDELGQALTVLKFKLDGFRKDFVGATAGSRRLEFIRGIESLEKLVDETGVLVQRIARSLRPSILDDLGLPAALRWQAEEFQSRTGIGVATDISPDMSHIGELLAAAVFRIAQESLTNVARHAKASSVRITLEETQGALRMVVEDDGRGLASPDKNRGDSLGILGMRERAASVGGELAISGRPGLGTTVTLTVPLDAGRAKAR